MRLRFEIYSDDTCPFRGIEEERKHISKTKSISS
jgi:hypothetical protein